MPTKPRVMVKRRAATERQALFLEALRCLHAALHRGPSAAEVGEYMLITRHGARKQLLALEAKGLVRVQLERGQPPLWLAVEL